MVFPKHTKWRAMSRRVVRTVPGKKATVLTIWEAQLSQSDCLLHDLSMVLFYFTRI